MELGRAIKYNITIEPSNNKGFIVKIGCGKFVAETKKSLLNNLSDYIMNPEEWEKRYNESDPDGPTPEAPRDEGEDRPEQVLPSTRT